MNGYDSDEEIGISDSEYAALVKGDDWSGKIIFTYENYVWSDNTSTIHGKYYWADGKIYE